MAGSSNGAVAAPADYDEGLSKGSANAIFAILEVIIVLAVMATLHLAIVVHGMTLKRDYRMAVRKPARPHHATV